MSFAIIISEKGGQERREVFDKNEISIGRVQGNDLLLPKGNVSKRHARIVFRDGRFIVTDLKSTNGSYVNGHRIAQATIVREGDKIYIGDFILKVDAGTASSSSPNSPTSPRDERRSHDGEQGGPADEDRSVATPLPRAGGIDGSAVSHIPLEQDPDDISGSGLPALGSRPSGPGGHVSSSPSIGPAGDTRPPRVAHNAPAGRSAAPGAANPGPGRASAVVPPPLPPSASIPAPPAQGPGAVGQPAKAVARPKPQPARPGHALALRALIERLADVVDLDEGDVLGPPSDAKRATVEKVLREQARALQQQGDLPAAVTSEELVRQALDEALHVGPLGMLLEDEQVREIHVHRFDHITAVRGTEGATPVEVGFTTEAALRRAIGRLARASGERSIDGASELTIGLGGRGVLRALFPPAAPNGVLASIRKSVVAGGTLDDLVRAGALSRPMASLLHLAVGARSNILIVGSSSAAPNALLQALTAAFGADERVLAVDEAIAAVSNLAGAASITTGAHDEAARRIARTAFAMHPDRAVVEPFHGVVADAALDAIGGGLDGVIAVAHASSSRQALHRIAASIAARSDSSDAGGARALVEASFDLVVEVGRLRAGKQRVLHIAEISTDAGERKLRDIFEFVVDAAQPERGEGIFQPTGVVPMLVQEQKALGVRVDDAGYRRSAAVRVA